MPNREWSLDDYWEREMTLDEFFRSLPSITSDEKEYDIFSLFDGLPQSNLDIYETVEIVVKDDPFENFISTLTHPVQTDLRNFIRWLSKHRGKTISFDQIKDNWAKHKGVSRTEKAIMPLVHIAKSKKLLTTISDKNWQVRD